MNHDEDFNQDIDMMESAGNLSRHQALPQAPTGNVYLLYFPVSRLIIVLTISGIYIYI